MEITKQATLTFHDAAYLQTTEEFKSTLITADSSQTCAGKKAGAYHPSF